MYHLPLVNPKSISFTQYGNVGLIILAEGSGSYIILPIYTTVYVSAVLSCN